MEFFFVRHGESAHNAAGLFCGQLDSLLTEQGRLQAVHAARALRDEHLDWIVSSPLQRAYDTAVEIARDRDVPVFVEPRLREHRKGILEGSPYRMMRSAEWAAVHGAESMVSLHDRVADALADLEGRLGANTVGAIVSHAGVARAIECVRIGEDPERLYDLAKVGNAAPYRVTISL